MYELLNAFVQGFFTISTNACLLPLYPGLVAFLATQVRDKRTVTWLGIPVLAGIITSMMLVGIAVAVLKVAFDAVLIPAAYVVVIGMGLLLLTRRNPFARLPMGQAPLFKNPYVSGYVYGLLLGPMTLPCAGPGISAIFAISTNFETITSTLLYWIFFALGFGVPLLVLPMLAEPIQRRIIGWLTTHHDALNRASGALLVAIGIFGILTEITPQYAPDLELAYEAYPIYWLVVIAMVVSVGWWTQQHPASS
jgi:cytochrome c-type biogenesis protein